MPFRFHPNNHFFSHRYTTAESKSDFNSDKTKFEGKALKRRPYIKRSGLLRVRLYTNLNLRYAWN